MAKTFKWRVERAIAPTLDFKVITAQFGDGYTQTSSDGINNLAEQWAITTHGSTEETKQMIAFFKEHKGVKSFFWTPPLGDLGLYTCADPSYVQQSPTLYVITGTFVRSYSSLSGV